MDFIHIADVHLDKKVNNIGDDGKRRREQIILAFEKMINFIINKNVKYLFIAGDFYEHEYIKDSTIQIIIDLFKKAKNTKIYITPGNHDPYIEGSVYNRFKFPENVYIFKHMEVIQTDDANIFGVGFTDFYPSNNVNYRAFKPLRNGKKNILIAHTDIYAKKYEYDREVENLIRKGFDYVALGHIHKGNFNKNQKIIYPGSFMEFSFKASSGGSTGAVYGNFKSSGLFLENINFDNTKYIKYELDISNEKSISSLIISLNNLVFKENEIVKIILKGEKSFDINQKYILDNLNNKNIIQIEDDTKMQLKYNKYIDEISLRGFFVKKAEKLINALEVKISLEKDENIKEEYLQKIKMIERAIIIVLEEMKNI